MSFFHRRIFSFCVIVCTFFVAGTIRAQTITNDLGLSLHVDAASGEYQIILKAPPWTIGGSLSQALHDVSTGDGKDSIPANLHEIKFGWKQEGARSGSIRLYRARPIVLFGETFVD